jgi:catechol 2,3-dioxygenase-like lactoylglutathione lyase family enzyme|tara:strand:- start:187 stop:768 length:582 start_codon:yes stop_codon:yes gene_type:complete
MSNINLNGVHHLALVCKDMERTVDFYTNILGLRLTKGFDLAGYGQHFFFDMGNGSDLAFFWFNDAPEAAPGVASAKSIVGTGASSISSAHGSMNHVAFDVPPDKIADYREELIAKGVECSPIVNHNDVVTGEEARTATEASEKTWLQSFYFFDPDRVMLEFCATLQPGLPNVDLPVNAEGIKANGEPITGVPQ